MRLKVWVCMVMMVSVLCAAPTTTIQDVDTKDSNRKAIEYAVDNGFLNLFQDNKFRSKQAINRNEMAFVLYKLKRIQQSASTGSGQGVSDDVQHIRDMLSSIQAKMVEQNQLIETLKTEKNMLHHDISMTQDTMRQALDKTQEDMGQQRLWLWLAVGAVGVMGLSK